MMTRAMTGRLSRRTFLLSMAAGAVAARARGLRADAPRPAPSAAQLAWQQDELAMFLHFGVNTFTDREWGDGREPPSIFTPARLDARQWSRAAKAAGFRTLVLTDRKSVV